MVNEREHEGARERDLELARLFEELRREDALRVPPFRRILERRAASRSRRIRWAPIASAAAAVVLVAAAVLLVRPGAVRREPQAPASAIAEWRSPTDFLLETPGSELLETAPDFATTAPEWVTATGGAPPRTPAPGSTPSPSRSNPLEKGATS